MFINKINNFHENNSQKNREDWFSKDELKSDFDISSRHQSENGSDNTFVKRVTVSETTIGDDLHKVNKEERLMIDKSKIYVNYVREPSGATIDSELRKL